MKKYKEYIKENHLDVDPYGEEEWEDEIYFYPGDKVICIKNCNNRYTANDKICIKKGDIKQVIGGGPGDSVIWFTDTPHGQGNFPAKCFKKI